MTENWQPTRHLDLKGSTNVRDLGGYPTADGRRTRWQTFLRSGSMHALPPESRAALLDYGVRTVIDLRTTAETADMPNVFSGSSRVRYYHLNMIGDSPLSDSDSSIVSGGETSDLILASYSAILDQRQAQIGETMAILASQGARPVMYHCAGGKDRTGIVSALVLGIAGVDHETIAEDYALTACYLMERYFAEQAPPGVTAENFTWRDYRAEFCPPDAMLKVLGYLDERYGGTVGYVRGLGLGDEQIEDLRAAFVE